MTFLLNESHFFSVAGNKNVTQYLKKKKGASNRISKVHGKWINSNR